MTALLPFVQTRLTFLVLLGGLTPCAPAASILLVDDSEGLPIQPAWTSTLSQLGHSVTIETIAPTGSPTLDLSNYDAVIWSIGDRAYENLTAQNWATMTQYVNAGGKLIYAGGHSVYQENWVGHAGIEAFFGVSGTLYNMPMWGSNTTITGVAGGSPFNNSTYTIVPYWAGGQYGNMFSGFNVSTGTALVNMPVVTNGAPGPYIVAQNAAGTAQLWGLDINHVAEPDREAFLAHSLEALGVPEPSTALLFGSLTVGLLGLRRRPRGVETPGT